MKGEKSKVKGRIARNRLFFFVSLFTIYYLLFAVVCFAGDADKTVITSDRLDYFGETKKYVATGSATVEKAGAVLKSDEITFLEDTSEAVAVGRVTYEDPDSSVKAAKAEMNLDAKTGTLFDAEVLYKKYNYHIRGKEIEKRAEDYYYSPDATFTTCDAPVPEWCFKGKDVNAVVEKRVISRDSTFRILDIPVFYTPYLYAPLMKDRQTGFLMPVISNSSTRGASLTLPFFWAIAENRNATIVLDAYSKRGIGTGLEYRFLEPGGASGNWWAYNIKDTLLEKDFWEVRGLLYENRHADSLGGYLNVNYVNDKDFYQQYSTRRDIRIQRYLESTGEVNLPLNDSRLYLLSQYWKDLRNDTSVVPQKLPEAGYVLNYTRVGDFMFSAAANAANLWREGGISAERIDIYPRVLHSVGKDVVFTQAVALRETAYSFYKDQDEDNFKQRGAAEYDAVLHTRLYRTYSSFTHIIEPSVRYHFIYSSSNDLPLFDSTELYGKTSNIELSVLNRAIVKGTEIFAVRLTEPLDTYSGRPFLPLRLEVAVRTPVPLTMEASYDMYSGKLETVTSTLGFQAFKANFAVGETYSRKDEIMMFTGYVSFSPIKSVQVAGQMWYDAKGPGLRDVVLDVKYQKQCWGVRFEAVKTPGDFTMKVFVDLMGITSRSSQLKVREYSPTL
jgi:LPS-assembly protein